MFISSLSLPPHHSFHTFFFLYACTSQYFFLLPLPLSLSPSILSYPALPHPSCLSPNSSWWRGPTCYVDFEVSESSKEIRTRLLKTVMRYMNLLLPSLPLSLPFPSLPFLPPLPSPYPPSSRPPSIKTRGVVVFAVLVVLFWAFPRRVCFVTEFGRRRERCWLV